MQHCWMLHVALVCTSCCMLLDVVAQSLKPVKLFSQQLPTFLLFRDRRSVAQQCWICLHSSSNIVGVVHAHYVWFTKTYGLYPSHDAMHVLDCKTVRIFTYSSTREQARALRTRKTLTPRLTDFFTDFEKKTNCFAVYACPNIVESCCIRLHTTANMHATTPNIVGATMLGAVASVCTYPTSRVASIFPRVVCYRTVNNVFLAQGINLNLKISFMLAFLVWITK